MRPGFIPSTCLFPRIKKMTIKILLVEDKTSEWLLEINNGESEIVEVKFLEEAVKELSDRSFDLVLLDLFLPDSKGLITLSRLRSVTSEISIIVLAGLKDENVALEALQLGAQDYLIKEQITPELLKRSIRYAMELSHSRRLREESDRRFQAIFNQSLDLMLLLTPDGMVSQINQTAENCTGLSPEAVSGCYLWEIPIWNQSPETKTILQEAVKKGAEGDLYSCKIALFMVEKLVKTVDFSIASAIDESGKTAMLIAKAKLSGEDRLVTTENLQTIEKELYELKSKILTTVSHEFRTPISTILLSSGLLESYGHKWLEERKKSHFQRIQGAIERMTKLLDEVLVISKVEAGKIELKPESLELENFCRSLMEEWKNDFGSDRLIRFSYNGNCSTVEMDAELIEQILSHLLSNAIKFSPVDRPIDFELNCVAPLAERNNGLAIFKIRDRGIGIPTAEQKGLFQTFFRASNVGTISGRGLGLAIVQALVDLHGGQITVESTVDVGTIITVGLPFNTN